MPISQMRELRFRKAKSCAQGNYVSRLCYREIFLLWEVRKNYVDSLTYV